MNTSQKLNQNITFKSLIKFSLHTILSMLFMNIYTTIDGVFVSKLVGTDALSAINIVMPIIMFSMATGTMFGSYDTALVSKIIGEKKEKEARPTFSLLVLISFLVSVLLSAICLVFMKPLLYFLGSNGFYYNWKTSFGISFIYFKWNN